ncbi:MAG: hypothetical protein RIB60_05690 [Phycisphaerales bacterium]
MRKRLCFVIAFAAMCVVWAVPAVSAQDAPAADFVRYPDDAVTTRHSVTVAGERVDYVATAGTIAMVEGESADAPAASMFFIAYRKISGVKPGLKTRCHLELDEEQLQRLDVTIQLEGNEEAARIDALLDAGVNPTDIFEMPDPRGRPVSFSFNGGPGSSSVWLHLGVFGPKRVEHADDFGNPGAPPHRVIDNEYSLLDVSDWVFIDPVSTGFSRSEGDTSEKDFHGVRSDVQSVAEFIRRWLGDHDRWGSPKFIAGESYGTTRAAALSRELQANHGIALNGVVLVSAVLNFQTIRFNIGNDLPHWLFLPTFAATAHFHGQLEPAYQNRPVAEFLGEVERFAETEYLLALAQGDALPDTDKRVIAQRVARYTGLTPEYVLDTNLRVSMPRFPKELRRDEGITVGRLDSRFVAADRDDAGERYEFDPSYAAIQSIYTESLNDYVRRELGFESDLSYEILTSVWPWSYAGVGDNRYTNVADDLRETMQRVPSMRVFVASGYYDLATPYFATDYTFDHLMLREELRGNVEIEYYESGHMMYVHLPSLDKLSTDLKAFYARSLQE